MGNQAGNSQTMKILRLSLSVLMLAALSGCGVTRNLAATIPPAPTILFRRLSPNASDNARFYGLPEKGLIFNIQADVDAFLSSVPTTQYEAGGAIRETLPVIDFSKEQGILVLFGAQADGGYSGEISAIEEKPDRLVVHPIRWTPSNEPGAYYSMMVVYPYQYVAIPRNSKPIEFAPTVDRQRPGPWWSLL